MKKLATGMLIATLVGLPAAFAGRSADAASSAQPGIARAAASRDGGRHIIFLRDGRTIQADEIKTLGDRIRVETPAGRLDLPSSEVRSIHRLDSPSGSASDPPPAEVYRGLTQQMTDRVRGQIQEQSRPAQEK